MLRGPVTPYLFMYTASLPATDQKIQLCSWWSLAIGHTQVVHRWLGPESVSKVLNPAYERKREEKQDSDEKERFQDTEPRCT